MSYYNVKEHAERIKKVKEILKEKNLDFALIYFDEFNLANGWYLSAWCPQFETGAVMVPCEGEAMIISGPESQPFALMDSAIKKYRNLPAFMVPNEEYPNAKIITFAELFNEISSEKAIKRVGIIGGDSMPCGIFVQIKNNFNGVEIVDITDEYLKLRVVKSEWEIEQIRSAFSLSYKSYLAMKQELKVGAYEYEVAAAGEYAARHLGANDFAFKTIVGSGVRANAVVPTASNRKMLDGELCMLGISPKIQGYAGVMGDTLPVSGKFTPAQKECMNHVKEAYRLTKDILKPGISGMEIDVPGRKYYTDHGLLDYLVCPFVHTIGINEAESPFFGPGSRDVLVPGMTICIDVSFFSHPEFNGARIETGYVVTEKGIEPLCPEMDKQLIAAHQ